MSKLRACLLAAVMIVASGLARAELLEDLAYTDTGNPRHTLHLLLPNEVSEPLPLVISLHGGGWNRGTKDHALRLLEPLAADGEIALASVGYRLSGEAIWPAQLEDIRQAYHWLVEHAADYGVDAGRIAVIGSSAGGHLAMMLGTQPDVDIDAVISLAGPTDLTTIVSQSIRTDHASPHSIGAQLIGGALDRHQAAAMSASPAILIDGNEPPHLMFHGDLDGVIPFAQSVEFDTVLEHAGVPSTLVRIAGADHGTRMPWPQIRELTSLYLRAIFAGEAPPLSDMTIPYATQ